MPIDQVLFVAGSLMLASAVQTTVGIGYPLIAVPLLLMAGFPPAEAITVSATSNMLGMFFGLYHHRLHVRVRPLLPWVAVCLSMIPVGAALLWLAAGDEANDERGVMRQVVGAMVLAALVVQRLLRVKPREHVAPGWGVLATVSSGVSTGLTGIGGPPLVLWVLAHDWPAARVRASLWVFFIPFAPVQMICYTLFFGGGVLYAALLGAAFLPAVLVGTVTGLWLGKRVDSWALRVATTVLLIIIGLTAILSPLLG